MKNNCLHLVVSLFLSILAGNMYAQEPTTQISNLSVSNITCTSALVQWTNGNGNRRILIFKESSAVDGNPTDGITYASSAFFGFGQQIGTGNYVVFIGPVNLVNVQGLKSNTTYHLKAYEYNDNAGIPDYLPIAPPVASFTTLGINLSFSISKTDSCWNRNQFTFTNTTTTNFAAPVYSWDFGDGTTSTAANPIKSYNLGGDFKIKLTVNPNFGCKDSTEKRVIVIPKPNIVIGVDNDEQCLSGNLFNFSNLTTYPNLTNLGLTRTWNFGDGTNAITSKPQKTYTAANVYTIFNYVEMVYNNRPTGCKDTGSFNLTVYPDPTGEITFTDTINCIGKNRIEFDNPASNIIRYEWDFGDGSPVTTNRTASHTYVSNGDYRVIHTAESSFGCFAKDTVMIYARQANDASFTGITSPLCNDDNSITLNPINNNGIFFGNGISGNQYTPSNIGLDTIIHIIPDLFCPDTASFELEVLVGPEPDLGPDQNLCNQNNILLAESIAGSYTWNDNSTANDLLVNRTGTYWLEVNDGICTGRDSVYIYFGTPPVLRQVADTFICKNSILELSFSNPDTRYLWNDGSRDSSKIISSGGLYTLTATNPCGNTAITFNVNQLKDDCNVLMPNAFSPNGDGRNELYKPSLLSDKIIVNQFLIFNKYGEIVFEGKEENITWNGKYKGELVPTNDIYYYLLYYTLPISDNTQKGKLTGSIYILN